MKRSTKILVILVLFLLVTGYLFFILINPEGVQSSYQPNFQTWLWEKRGMDLVVQVLLVFSGALGIAAILPLEEE
jgi:hypothetical protein